MNSSTGPTHERKRKFRRGFFLETLLRGFLILLPLTIVLILLSIVFKFIFGLVAPISAVISPGSNEPHWSLNLLSLSIFIAFIFIIGVVIKNKLGRRYFHEFEKRYLTKIPLYNLIHQTVYQFVGLKKLPFTDVVLIDPFRTGTLMTGFVTDRINDDMYTVFVPTAPNPTNGNIYHVPKDAITFISATSQDAIRTIMGMGTGTCTMLKDSDLNNDCSLASEKNMDNDLQTFPTTDQTHL